jgi:hypothetical protein
VLASQDLSVWNVIGTVTAGGQGMVTFTDAAGGRYPARFYMLHEVTYLSAAPVYTLALGPDGDLEVQISGLVGHTYEILGTPDFATWFSVGEVTIGMGGTGALTDPGSAGMFLFYTVQEVTGH